MKTITRLLVVLLFLAGLSVLAASPASAASCYGRYCNNLDPQASGCAYDATTLDEFTIGGTRIELRYSNTCWAAWARATNVTPGVCGCVAPAIEAYVNGSFIARRDGEQPYAGNGNQTWTVMLSFSYYVQACTSMSLYSACTAQH